MKFSVFVCFLFVFLLIGCSSQKNNEDSQKNFRGDFSEGRMQRGLEGMNGQMPEGMQGRMPEGFDDGQRQQMMAEMLQKSVDACAGKIEGDVCQLQGFRGPEDSSVVDGNCLVEQNNLVCKFQRIERPDFNNEH